MKVENPQPSARPRVLALAAALMLLTAAFAVAAEAPAPAQVEVHLSEYAINMPHTLPAGPTVFTVSNDGVKIHSFKIEGPGIDQLLAKPVPPHEKGTLEVTLKAGEYKVYCPVGSHAAKGMTLSLVVTAPAAG